MRLTVPSSCPLKTAATLESRNENEKFKRMTSGNLTWAGRLEVGRVGKGTAGPPAMVLRDTMVGERGGKNGIDVKC